MSDAGLSKRRYRRLGLSLPATLRRNEEAAATSVSLENLGPDGCFLRTGLELNAGEIVTVEFDLDNLALPIQAQAEVRWVRRGEGGGVGLHFCSISDFEKSTIGDFIFRNILDTRPR